MPAGSLSGVKFEIENILFIDIVETPTPPAPNEVGKEAANKTRA
jgi:hypothetical protein